MTHRGVAAILTEADGFAVTASTPDPAKLGDLGVFDPILVDQYLEDDTPYVPLAAASRVLVMSASRRQGDVRAELPRLPVAVLERDQFLGAVGADPAGPQALASSRRTLRWMPSNTYT